MYPNSPIPIAKWRTIATFETLAKCEQSSSTEVQKRIASVHLLVSTFGFSNKLEGKWKDALSQAKCIQSDDPGLKRQPDK